MSVPDKGLPMDDPQYIRCSDVQSCPTVFLSFGHYGVGSDAINDRLLASWAKMIEALRDG